MHGEGHVAEESPGPDDMMDARCRPVPVVIDSALAVQGDVDGQDRACQNFRL